MSDHKIIRPSSASVWVECNGSIQAQQFYPDNGGNQTTKEGDLAHWVAAEVLMSYALPPGQGNLKFASDFIDHVSDDGVMVDQDMVDGVDMYVSDVLTTCQRAMIGKDRKIEHFFDAPTIHDDNGGTIDSHSIDHDNKVIYVWDFKYGYVYVEVEGNWQLINYARAIMDSIGAVDTEWTFVFTIVQPRCFDSPNPIRRWTVNAAELRPYVNRLHAQAHTGMGESPTMRPGTHCLKCSARHACKALADSLHLIYDSETDFQLVDYDNDRLGRELDLAINIHEMAESRLEMLREVADYRSRNGKVVRGWELEPVTGNMKWDRSDADVIKVLGGLYDVNLKKPDAAITPRQAINKKLLPEDVVKKFAPRQSKGMKLVKTDPNKAAAVFGDNKQ